MAEPALVYSADRVRRIRTALGAAVGLGVLTGIIGVLVATQAEDAGSYAVALGVVSVVSILLAVLSWRLLDGPASLAKRAVVTTGVVSVLFALVTFQVVVGLIYVILGLVLIFLAVISEEGAGP